jgi:hypothetical protein
LGRVISIIVSDYQTILAIAKQDIVDLNIKKHNILWAKKRLKKIKKSLKKR